MTYPTEAFFWFFAQNIDHGYTLKPSRWGGCKMVIFRWTDEKCDIFSSPEPSGSQGELIVYPWSGVRRRRRFTFSNIFFSETARPIKAKLHVESPWEGGTKVNINNPGHMTKMAAMLKNAQNLQKYSSPEPVAQFPRNLVCGIWDSSPS